MQRLVRHNLSGGLLSPSLWTRSDLEQYAKGNKQQSNFLSTPHGGLERRPPASLLGSIPPKESASATRSITSIVTRLPGITIFTADTGSVSVDDVITISGTTNYDGDHIVTSIASGIRIECSTSPYEEDEAAGTYTVPLNFAPSSIRGFPFVYDITTKYSILLVSYEFTGQDSFSSFEIYADNGTFKQSISAPYPELVFNEVDFKQVNDVIMFAHRDYEPARLARYGDADWKYELLEFNGGPFLSQNTDKTNKVSLDVIEWDGVGVSYDAGSIVQVGGTPLSITGHTQILFSQYYATWGGVGFIFKDYHEKFETESDHGFAIGDRIYLTDITAPIRQGGTEEFDTAFTIISTPAPDEFVVNLGFRAKHNTRGDFLDWHTLMPPLTWSGGKVNAGEMEAGFYQAIIDHTSATSNGPPDINNWERKYSGFSANLDTNIDLFSELDIGRKILILTGAVTITGEFPSTTLDGSVSDSIPATGTITLTTGGIWSELLILEYTTDEGSTWDTIASLSGMAGTKNYEISRIITEQNALVRLRKGPWAGSSEILEYTLSADNYSGSPATITEYVSPRNVVVFLNGGFLSGIKTYKWSFGAFGGVMGYPSTITIHEERLMMGGTSGRPFEIYGSQVNDWTNFAIGTLVTSPIIFRMRSDNVTRICWMLSSQNRLFIGTDFGEYSATTPEDGTVLSGENPPRITLHTTYGSDEQKALAVHNEIVHVTADRKTMRAIAEGEYKETYGSKDLTVFSPDISSEGIVSIALQRNPYPVIWATTSDGKLLAFTYDVENGILGWSQVVLKDATIKSHWILPDDDGIDELYMSVQRDGISIHASGNCSPDLTGLMVVGSGFDPITISGSDDVSVNGDSPYDADSPISGNRRWDVPTIRNVNISGSKWYITSSSGEFWEHAESPVGDFPPKTDWPVGGFLGKSAPYLEYGHAYDAISGVSFIDKSLDGSMYYLYDSVTRIPYFESATLLGEYLPISSTGEGSVTLSELTNHVIRLNPSADGAGEYTDLFDEPIESVVEFTSLIQGAGLLERNVVTCGRMLVYLVESQGGEVSVDGGESWVDIPYDDDDLYTGHKEIRVKSGNTEELRVMVRTTGDDPFELTSVAVDVEQQSTGV